MEHQNKFRSIVALLHQRARLTPEKIAYTFLLDGESVEQNLTYGELHQKAMAIACNLQQYAKVGDRALLLYPQGLEYLVVFFSCLYAGIVAVPAYPPRKNRSIDRIRSIARDCQASMILSPEEIKSQIASKLPKDGDDKDLLLISTDGLDFVESTGETLPSIDADTIAFLQYTSGSTGTPKGVMVTHGNLLHNQEVIRQGFSHDETTVFVNWLPLYHDMGLIGNVLQPLYLGIRSVLMSPVSFLQKPLRWLNAISNYKGTTAGAPNFAYDLCVQRASEHDLREIDLSSLTIAYNGAEPIRANTLKSFVETFGPCKLRSDAFYPCYGLAEATLLVAGGTKLHPPVVLELDAAQLENNLVRVANKDTTHTRCVVSSGRVLLDQRILVVDPQSRVSLPENSVGEIWVSGPSVAKGYWNNAKDTEETFQAFTSDTGVGPFLRTGDMGFLSEGSLFVTGRSKELIIIRGRNCYPSDIEFTAQNAYVGIRPNASAAFSIRDENEQELLMLVCEVERQHARQLDVETITDKIKNAIFNEHELDLFQLILIAPGSLPKTSSGKIQRRLCLKNFLEGTLESLAVSEVPDRFFRRKTITQNLAWRSLLTPRTIILEEGAVSFTARQVESASNKLAHYLQGHYADINLIGIDIKPSFCFVVAALAVLKTQKPFTLISAGFVKNRDAFFEAGVRNKTLMLVDGDGQGKSDTHALSVTEVLNAVDYVGVPLGVQHPSGNLFVEWVEGAGQGKERIITNDDIQRYFSALDEFAGDKKSRDLVVHPAVPADRIFDILWAMTRGVNVTMVGENAGNEPVEFSLLYFANDATHDLQKYKLVLKGAEYADQVGFKAVWIPERHFHPFGGLYPNPAVLAAALAMNTNSIRLRAGSVVLPLHDPLRVAEEWSVVDNLSNGRVDLAFARGWNPNDFVLQPHTFLNSAHELFTRLEEFRKIWKGHGVLRTNGQGKEVEVKTYPRPIQSDLNCWITCTGGVERFVEAGKANANVLTALLFQSVDELADKIRMYRTARKEAGHSGEGIVTVMLHTFVGADKESVRTAVKTSMLAYLESSVDLWKNGSQQLSELSAIEKQQVLEYAFERYCSESSLIGTVGSCYAMVEKLEAIGVDEIASLIDFGVDTDTVLQHLPYLSELRNRCRLVRPGVVNGVTGTDLFPEGYFTHINGNLQRVGGKERVDHAGGFNMRDHALWTTAMKQVEVYGDRPSVLQDERPRENDQRVEMRIQDVTDLVHEALARVLDESPNRLPRDRSFSQAGLDSLKAVELMNTMSKTVGIELSPTMLFEFPTVEKLGAAIRTQLEEAKIV